MTTSVQFDVTEVPLDESPFSKLEDIPEAPTVKSKPETELVVKALKKFYFQAGVMLAIIDFKDSQIVCTNADELAESWRQLLDSDSKLRRKMVKMMKAGGWGTVITAHLVVAIPIMSNHGVSLSHLFKRKTDEGTGDIDEPANV